MEKGTVNLKRGLAQMLKGGVIMDVVNVEQAKIAEEAGACAVMALERVPSDIRTEGGVARMSDPQMIVDIKKSVSIPVMAKARIGHFVEAQILQALGIDYVDESEVLTPADEVYHINKNDFTIPFVCGCRDLGEALRRINEGAAMIRTKGEAGTGNVVEAVRHIRAVYDGIARLKTLRADELEVEAATMRVPVALLIEVRDSITPKQPKGHLPVVNFAAGGVATPADAALMMQLGCDGVFVGSGIFKAGTPPDPKASPEEQKRQRELMLAEQARLARAIVQAVTHFKDAKILAEVSKGLGKPMSGRDIRTMKPEELLATRGW